MNIRNNICIFFTILTIFTVISCKTTEVEVIEEYTHQEITDKLDELSFKVRSGQQIETDTKLISSLYNNRDIYPIINESLEPLNQLQQILQVYINTSTIFEYILMKDPDNIDEDGAKLISYVFSQSARIIYIAENYLESLEQSDPSYNVRANGLYTAYDGLIMTMKGVLLAYFVETYNKEVQEILSIAIDENFYTLVTSLPEDKKLNFLFLMEQDIRPSVRADLMVEFEELIKTLN